MDLVQKTAFSKDFFIFPIVFYFFYEDSEKDKMFHLNLFLIFDNKDYIKSFTNLTKRVLKMLHPKWKPNWKNRLKNLL